jgi:uncharacterized membrane protein
MQNPGKSAFDLDANVAAGLAYIPVCFVHLIISIAILVTDKTNKLPRFHAVQSLLLWAAMIVGYIAAFIVAMVIMVIAGAANAPGLMILSFLVYAVFMIYALGCLVMLIISCIKAFQGQIFRIPLIGAIADKWSN